MPLSIVEWNTRNFFDSFVNPATPSETVLSATDYANKRKTIGAALKALDGDIVVLAEIENKGVLDDLNKAELGGAYSQTILIEGNDSRGIDVGVLSKIAPDSVVSHKDEYFVLKGTNGPQYRFARDCLEVHFTVNQRELIVLGVHFRAKSAPDDPDKRLAEAQHARQIADDLHAKKPGAAILIVGDYNDTPGSPPYAAVMGAAPDLFVDSADVVPFSERYSYTYQGNHELIDHQAANPGSRRCSIPRRWCCCTGRRSTTGASPRAIIRRSRRRTRSARSGAPMMRTTRSLAAAATLALGALGAACSDGGTTGTDGGGAGGGSTMETPISWTALPTAGAPTARYLHTAVWTGRAMIVWGGRGARMPQGRRIGRRLRSRDEELEADVDGGRALAALPARRCGQARRC